MNITLIVFCSVKYQFLINNAKVLVNDKIVFVAIS